MAEWVMKKLKDIADFNPRESLAKGTVAKKIGMDKLQPFCRDVPGYELEPFSGGTKFRNGDTIMARITPCLENGKTAKVSILDDGEVGFGSTEYIVFRAKDGVDEDFIYYLVCSPLVREPAIKSMVGSSGRQRVQTDVVQNLEIMVPDYEEQRRISGLLKLLDDKIELNNAINNNLEEQAVVLFRSWFSAFSLSPNSPRINSEFGEIPEDFTVVKVGSLPMLVTDYVANGSFASLKANVNLYQEPNYAYFIRNTDLKSGSFGVFIDQHSYEFLSKSTLYGGEIIISNVGDVGSVFLCPKLDGRMTLGNNIIMLKPEDNHLRYYLYIWFKYLQGQALIQGIKGGSAQPKFNKTDFKNTSVLIPPKDILTRFHETVAPMFETISQRQTETSRLVDLRDTLLSQLMSGKIDVSNLDR
jgi:putative toxin-antitoxin system, toxin component